MAVDPWAVKDADVTDPWAVQGQQDEDSPYLGMIDSAEGSDRAVASWNKRHPNQPISTDQVRSPKGAVGRYQIMPATAEQYGLDPDQLSDPAYNKMAANVILNDLHRRYGDDYKAIAAAYNGGPGRANNFLRAGRDTSVLPAETRDYVNGIDPWTPLPTKGAPAAPTPQTGPQPSVQTNAPTQQPKDTGIMGMLESGVLGAQRDIGRVINTIGAQLPPQLGQFGRQIGLLAQAMPAIPGAAAVAALDTSSRAAAMPEPKPTVQTSPIDWSHGTDLRTAAEKVGYQTIRAVPTLAAGMVAGPIGAGVTQGGISLAQNYEAEKEKTPDDLNGAFDRASKSAGVDAVFTTLGWKAFDVKVFKGAVKNLLAQGLGVQPAIAVAQTATQNYLDGQPITQGIPDAYLQGATVQTLMLSLGHLPGAITKLRPSKAEAPRQAAPSPAGREPSPSPVPPGKEGVGPGRIEPTIGKVPPGAPTSPAEARRAAMKASIGLGPRVADPWAVSASEKPQEAVSAAPVIIPEAPRPTPQAAAPDSAGLPSRPIDNPNDVAITSSGREVPVRYAVVEAHHLVPSQTADGRINPAYPQELQPRDRSRAVSDNQIAQIAQNLNPKLLDRSPNAADGAPIIGPSGVVESGNGRTLALQRAYRDQLPSAEVYRAHLEAMGYPVEGMSYPVLVRVRTGELSPEDRQAFVREVNQPAQLSYSATEQAMNDGRALSDESLNLYRGGDVEAAGNREFVRQFMRQAVPENEHARMFDRDGGMTQDAIRRVRNALFAKAYGDPDLVGAIAESPDSNIKAIGGALTDAAPEWAKMRTLAAKGDIPPDLDRTNHLLEAARIVAQARAKGVKLGDLIAQDDVFKGRAVSPDVEAWLRLMFWDTKDWKQPVGRERVAETVRSYAQQASEAQVGPNLLGLPEVAANDILIKAREKQLASKPQTGTSKRFTEHPGERAGGDGGKGAGREVEGAQAPRGWSVAAGLEPIPGSEGIADNRPFAPLPPGWTNRDFAQTAINRPLDLGDELARYLTDANVKPNDPAQLLPQLMAYIHDRGYVSGAETTASWNYADNVLSATTLGHPSRVVWNEAISSQLEDPAAQLVTLHNHPTSNAPSGPDLMSLAMPGHSAMLVVNADGTYSAARLAARPTAHFENVSTAIRAAYEAAVDEVRRVLQPFVKDGSITSLEAARAIYYLANHALDRAGITDYITSAQVPKGDHYAMGQALRSATYAAREAFDAQHAAVRAARSPDRVYRPAWAVQHGPGVSAILEVLERNATRGTERAAGAGGQEGSREVFGGSRGKPEQLRLLEGEEKPDLFAVEPGAADARGSALSQTIIPGAEKSAQQLAKAREILGHGRKTTSVEQKESEGLFGPPKVKHPDLFEELGGGAAPPSPPPPGGGDTGDGGGARRWLRSRFQAGKDAMAPVVRDARMLVSPMTAGGVHERAAVKDWLNTMRLARDVGMEADRRLRKNFTFDQQKKMWLALDEQSIAEQRGERTDGIGLDRLEPAERKAVEAEHLDNVAAWRAATDVGLVSGEAIPHYAPHMAVEIAETGAKRIGGEGVRAIPGIGRNLKTSTPQLRNRKYETIEEMEGALRRGNEGDIQGVRNIRTLPYVTARLREAAAGRALINEIKKSGKATGEETVSEGTSPGHGWFTIPSHPSFWTWKPRMRENEVTGKLQPEKNRAGDIIFDKVPVYVKDTWEGPLRAGLTGDEGAVYRLMMKAKEKAMNNIMFSPLVQLHLMTELGRSLPAAPMKVLTGKILFEGFRAKNDPKVREEAILHGMVPIGHRGALQDITSMAEPDSLVPGRTWTAKLVGFIPGLYDKALGTNHKMAVRAAIDKAGDLLHHTLLWDRVSDLQFGLYTNLRDHAIRQGMTPDAAQYLAAHWANRYAGALPQEAMSAAARKMANLMLFSRTYTLGNLGVYKDMVNGLPMDVQAQIARDGGLDQLKAVKSLGRRKAIAMIALDVALLYTMNSVLQNAFQYFMGQKPDEIMKGYVDRAQRWVRWAKNNPLHALNPMNDLDHLAPTADNEIDPDTGIPLKRILVGHEADGTAIYMRNPLGKFAEEMQSWTEAPGATLRNKLSTFAHPTYDWFKGSDNFDRNIYEKTDPAAVAAAKVIGHYMEAQLPMDQLKSGWKLAMGRADAVEGLRLAGRTVGVTFRKGYPGGPEMGMLHELRQEQQDKMRVEMPEITQLIRDRKIPEARQRMRDLDVPPRLINYIVRSTINPRLKLNTRNARELLKNASPDQRARMNQGSP